MKLKCIPADFQVTEHLKPRSDKGPFALYQLSKTESGTLEAIATIRRKWQIPEGRIQHAGLKDHKAVTTQYVTIRNGPRSDCQHDQIALTYVGQTDRNVTPADIASNEFRIVVRDLNPSVIAPLQRRLNSVARAGYPNYFDEQRFGSVPVTGRFVAQRVCRRDYATAVWLALAEHNVHDPSGERKARAMLRQHWNDWPAAKAELPKSNRRSVVTYLCDHPTGFRKAFALISPDLRGLYLSAFQSAVWNLMLKNAVNRLSAKIDESVAALKIGAQSLPVVVPERDDLQTEDRLPEFLVLPSARLKKTIDQQSIVAAEEALFRFRMPLAEMKIPFPRDRWFSRGRRATVVRPSEFQFDAQNDDLHPGHTAISLAFRLPAGCYATMLLKCAFSGEVSDE